MEANNLISDTFELVRSLNFQNIHGTATDKHTRTYEYITYKDAVENLSKSSEHHLNEKKFLDLNDGEVMNFIDAVQEELNRHISQESVTCMKLRGRKNKSFTAWVLLKKDAKPIRIDASFLEKSTDDHLKVTAVTLLNSTEEERGLRISLKESKARLYEIVNGVHEIQFHWKVGDKFCSVVVCVSSNGTVAFGNLSKGLVSDDFKKNRAVNIRIGDVTNREMTLAELISRINPL